MDYLNRAKELADSITKDRRYFHMYPELGMEMPNTTAYVVKRLTEMGYAPQKLGGGVVATVGTGSKPVLLLRADMDALPIQEKSGLSFASTVPHVAHCCGHDNHAAMLLGAAKMLKENENQLQGTVKLMFQPGEETLQGARSMIEAGVLENPSVDAAFALHVNSLLPMGQMLVSSGAVTASSDKFEILVQGHGSHASRPHEAVDPIHVASFIHTGLMELHAREIPQQEFAVLSIGAFQAGEVGNAIPDTAVLKGSMRTYSPELRRTLIQRITVISEKIAEAFRATAQVSFLPNYTTSLVADPTIADFAIGVLQEMLGERSVRKMTQKNSASEDFAFVAEKVPSTLVILGAAIGPDVQCGQHNPGVIFHEGCLPIGAAAYAAVAHNWLHENKKDRGY